MHQAGAQMAHANIYINIKRLLSQTSNLNLQIHISHEERREYLSFSQKKIVYSSIKKKFSLTSIRHKTIDENEIFVLIGQHKTRTDLRLSSCS